MSILQCVVHGTNWTMHLLNSVQSVVTAEIVVCRMTGLCSLSFLSTRNIFLPEFEISCPDSLYFERIHNWIKSRVCVREQDANVES